MALHGEIKVNGMVIGAWSAVRQRPQGQPHADEVCDYDATVSLASAPDGCPAVLERFSIRHRFGDGALALASVILMKASMCAQVKEGS